MQQRDDVTRTSAGSRRSSRTATGDQWLPSVDGPVVFAGGSVTDQRSGRMAGDRLPVDRRSPLRRKGVVGSVLLEEGGTVFDVPSFSQVHAGDGLRVVRSPHQSQAP